VATPQRRIDSPTTKVVFFSMRLNALSCTAALQQGHRIVGCMPAASLSKHFVSIQSQPVLCGICGLSCRLNVPSLSGAPAW